MRISDWIQTCALPISSDNLSTLRSAGSLTSDWSGIGSGLGAPSASHASVQGERSWREGLPVRLFERTVSRAEAASILSFTNGLVSASAVVSPPVDRKSVL